MKYLVIILLLSGCCKVCDPVIIPTPIACPPPPVIIPPELSIYSLKKPATGSEIITAFVNDLDAMIIYSKLLEGVILGYKKGSEVK
jgi:hypothetical protein